MRKVFLDELPRRGNRIDWKKSIGYRVQFIYNDIISEIEIVDYNAKLRKLTIKYKDRIFTEKPISTGHFQNCVIGCYLGINTDEFKIEIGQSFKDNIRDLTITDREYRKKNFIDKDGYNCIRKEKWYKCTCNKCGWTEGWIIESYLIRKYSCSCCSSKTAVLGINTIWNTDRWMCDLGVSEEDAKKYTKGSDKKIEVTCQKCFKQKSMKIGDIYKRKSISCVCGDGYSYPEKITIGILNQSNIDYIFQLSRSTFEWCDKYRYDFYLPEYNMIIETHGRQHYEQAKGFYKTLEEEQENDRLKKELALSNGIKHYIELDCRYSDLEWIKNSVLNSELNELFDLSEVDWLKCEEDALSNLVKEVCDYWNNKQDWETTKDLEVLFKTKEIRRYLKKGTKLGWCIYDPKEEVKKCGKKNGIKCIGNCKVPKSVETFKDGESLGVFKSCAELERRSEELFGVKLIVSGISAVCNGKSKHYKGFTFRYIEEEDNQQLAS